MFDIIFPKLFYIKVVDNKAEGDGVCIVPP